MSLENGQDIEVISIYSIDNSICSKNQFSDIGVGKFGNRSSTKWIVRQGFCVLDDLIDKFPGSIRAILGYEILNLGQS